MDAIRIHSQFDGKSSPQSGGVGSFDKNHRQQSESLGQTELQPRSTQDGKKRVNRRGQGGKGGRPLIGVAAKIVVSASGVGRKSAGSGAHAVTVGSFDDPGSGGEGSLANRVVLGAGPEAENHQIGLMGLPPGWVTDVGRGDPDDRVMVGDEWRVADGFGRRVHDQPGIVAEVTKSFCQKPQISMPKKLARPNGQIGVEQNFQIT